MRGVETRVVEVEPWRIVEYEIGAGDPVVLVHGLGGSFEWWKRIVPDLARDYLVTGIDLPGFGAGRGFLDAVEPLPLREASALLGRWITERFDEPVHLVGHSMGGQIAAELTASRPDLVRTLSLLSSTGLPLSVMPRHVLRSLIPPRQFFSFLPNLWRDLYRAGPGSIALAAADMIRTDSRPALETIRAPTLIVWGSRDQLLPPSYGTEIHRMMSDSELSIIEGAGHLPMWEAAPRTSALLIDHFRKATDQSPETAVSTQVSGDGWAIAGCHDGICWRGVEQNPEAVLIHGLGIRSHYFDRLAAALGRAGARSAAPDLPGFGESWERDAWEVDRVAELIVAWARSIATSDAIWIGHSVGAQVVHRVRELAPELVDRAISVSPIWSDSEPEFFGLLGLITRDSWEEPPGLVIEAAKAYWESGLTRFLKAFRAYVSDLSRVTSLDGDLVICGREDPLVDLAHLEKMGASLSVIDGAHGIVWSHPDQIVDAIF